MLKIKKLRDEFYPPKKTHWGDAGWDVHTQQDIELQPGRFLKIPLGFAIEGEPGKVYRIEPKSGLAMQGIFTNGGIIDNNYRGEVHAILYNLGNQPVSFPKGSKVAQLLVCSVDDDNEIDYINRLSETTRGEGGFGSTGK